MLLNVKDLSVFLKETGEPIVCNVSFSLDVGKSLVILGQTGSGKTMTCQSIMGILNRRLFTPTGEIIFANRDLLSMKPDKQRAIYGAQIALIPQNPMTALDPSVRIGKQMQETLFFHTRLKGTHANERLDYALRQAGLDKPEDIMKRYPYMLSGGMLQRVLIAMALMVDAPLIIADEPTTALDAAHRNEAVETFQQLRSRGTAILLVTHDFAAASKMGGDLLVMKSGQVIECGADCDVMATPEHPYTKALIEASRLTSPAIERSVLAC